MNKVEKYKKEYIRSDVVMSEFLRSCDDLTVDEKRELLEENEAYKVLLRKQLNKEDESNG